MQQRSLSRVSLLSEQLQLALGSRITVEQAKGVVAEFAGVDMGAAFVAIRSHARKNQIKLSEVASSLVTRELLPDLLLEPGQRRRTPPSA